MFKNCSEPPWSAERKPRLMPPPPLCRFVSKALPLVGRSSAHLREPLWHHQNHAHTRYCKRCRKWRVPADTALGLEESAGYSPAVQEMAALLASKMPVEDASAVLEHLTGVKVPRATLDREARRQGERAQAVRTELDRQANTQSHSWNWPWNPTR